MDFEEQVKTVYPEAYRFARAIAGSEVDADDLLQDALVRAWRGYGRLHDRQRFKLWLLKIIRNTWRSRSRVDFWKRMVTLDVIAERPAETTLPYEEKELVRLALRGVPKDQREAVVLFEVLGLSIAEIAEVQQVKLSAAKSRVARGREGLRQRYHALANTEVKHVQRFAEAG